MGEGCSKEAGISSEHAGASFYRERLARAKEEKRENKQTKQGENIEKYRRVDKKMRKSLEEDNSLTEELLQKKYKGLNLDWD